jgi:hypothetical protein
MNHLISFHKKVQVHFGQNKMLLNVIENMAHEIELYSASAGIQVTWRRKKE